MKCRLRLLALLHLAWFLSPSAWASGGMSGGGGGLVRDRHNPWFLENTPRVTYCISIDPNHFQADISYARPMIVRALAYWKTEFSHAFTPRISDAIRPVKVATQEFTETGCNHAPDIRFQLGVLSPSQASLFDDPTEYAGAAIRETYDRVTLKATGFVYIAPDSGPLRYAGFPQGVDDPWRLGQGGLLYHTLVHEIGHIFGVQHTNEDSNPMSERFIEHVMHKDHYTYFANTLLSPAFFKSKGSPVSRSFGIHSLRGLPESTLKFFGLSTNTNGLWLRIKDATRIDVYSLTEPTPPSKAGEIELTSAHSTSLSEAVHLYLPKEQQVFHIPQELGLTVQSLPGPHAISGIHKGIYQSLDGQVKQDVIIHMTPAGPHHVSAVVDGVFISDVLGTSVL